MRSWIVFVAGALALGLLAPALPRRAGADQGNGRAAPRPESHTAASVDGPHQAPTHAPQVPPLARIDWAHLQLGQDGATAAGPNGRVARLTLDPDLQETADKLIHQIDAREATIVLMHPTTGRILVWAGHGKGRRDGSGGDGAVGLPAMRPDSPAASIFKIVTAAALVEQAGLTPDTRQCYSGGETRILASDLVDNPKRDRSCATLSEAMGRSLNVVFARLALRLLEPSQLDDMAKAFGFGQPLAFDYPLVPSEAHIPQDDLGFARTSAGFWNTTLSPLHGALIAATVANGGEMVRPVLVESVVERGVPVYRAPSHQVLRRVIRPDTATALTEMMEATVSDGTSLRAFRDSEGRAFLPSISVAGKTGTLGRPASNALVTWFVGFAPSRAPEVAIAVEVVNGPKWRAKANVVARELLRAYFAKKGAAGVTRPRLSSG